MGRRRHHLRAKSAVARGISTKRTTAVLQWICVAASSAAVDAFVPSPGAASSCRHNLCRAQTLLSSPRLLTVAGTAPVVATELSSPRSFSGFSGGDVYIKTSTFVSATGSRSGVGLRTKGGRVKASRNTIRMVNTDELSTLGSYALIFLTATVALVPACKKANISPVLGFLGAGLLLGPSGFSVIKDLNELDNLGELGIIFLLFEQGLELSLDRLKALSKFAFGLGTLQV